VEKNKKVLCDVCCSEINELYYVVEEKDVCKKCFNKYFADKF